MFERFTEQARRVIFFARHEAAQVGDTWIRCVHLLAGLAREQPALFREVNLTGQQVREIHNSTVQALGLPMQALPTTVEIPLDQVAKRSLNLATEAAEKFHNRYVMPVHLLWGVYQADPALRTELGNKGLTNAKLEAAIKKWAPAERDVPRIHVALHSYAGIGYDLHRLAEGRKLILGGIEVPFDKGPVGHSDGDVLSHAICDALLGAAGLGDIGTHFPDTDPKWKDASSLLFLEHTRALLENRGLSIAHVDAVVIAEQPKLGPHFPAMREALAQALIIRPEQINLKAKTHEGLGEIGRGEAIAAQVIATLEA